MPASGLMQGVLYLGSAFLLGISYFYRKQALKAKTQRADLLEQDEVYDLDRLKMLKDNLEGKYCLVSGILIRDENLSKEDIQKNYLLKRLKLDPKSRQVVVNAEANSW